MAYANQALFDPHKKGHKAPLHQQLLTSTLSSSMSHKVLATSCDICVICNPTISNLALFKTSRTVMRGREGSWVWFVTVVSCEGGAMMQTSSERGEAGGGGEEGDGEGRIFPLRSDLNGSLKLSSGAEDTYTCMLYT